MRKRETVTVILVRGTWPLSELLWHAKSAICVTGFDLIAFLIAPCTEMCNNYALAVRRTVISRVSGSTDLAYAPSCVHDGADSLRQETVDY